MTKRVEDGLVVSCLWANEHETQGVMEDDVWSRWKSYAE